MDFYDPSSRFLSVGEASAMLKLHRNSVYRQCRAGRLPAVKIGRHLLIDRAKLDKLLESRRRPLLHELRAARTRRNMSCADLSKRTGIPEYRIADLENGCAVPRATEIERNLFEHILPF